MNARRRARAKAVRVVRTGLVAAALVGLLGGCGPRTTEDDVDLTVTVEAGADRAHLVVIGVGYVCHDNLTISVLHREDEVIAVRGTGELPDNEDDYCDKYIDTGGAGPSREERRKTIEVDPGTYSVQTGDGVRLIEFEYADDGTVISSSPFTTLEEWRAAETGG